MGRRSKGKTLFGTRNKAAGNALPGRILLGGLAVAALLLFLLGAAYYQLVSYLQGDSFREEIAQGMRRSTGAEQCTLQENLAIEGNRIHEKGVQLRHAGLLEKAEARQISVELDRRALLGRRLHIRKLLMEEAGLTINRTPGLPAAKKKRAKATKRPSAATTRPAGGSAAPAKEEKESWFTLREVSLDRVECRDTDLIFRRKKQEYKLLGGMVTASPAPRLSKDAWTFTVDNARLHTPHEILRDAGVRSISGVYTGKRLDISDCRLMLSPGELSLKAGADLERGPWRADVQVNKADVGRLLSEDWKKRLMGELFGRIAFKGSGNRLQGATGQLSLQQGLLEGLPFLSTLPMGDRSYPYRSLELEQAECRISFPYNDAGRNIRRAWLLDQINLRAKGDLLLVRGHIIIGEDGALGGTLTLGLPESSFALLPLQRNLLEQKLFTAQGEPGFLWVNINLSGSLETPQEDLSIRISTLLKQALPDAAGNALNMFGKLLQNIPATLPETESEEEDTPEAETNGTIPTPVKITPQPIRSATEAAGGLLRSLF